MWMQDWFYLEQRSKELLPVENNPNIELVKETGLRPNDDKTVKTWLWVAYGMVAVKMYSNIQDIALKSELTVWMIYKEFLAWPEK